jgi:hypothetical protein
MASSFGDSILNGDLVQIDECLNPAPISWIIEDYEKFRSGLFLLNKNELRLLRNTIYAKYGYIFNSPDLQRHFSQFSWYNGTKRNVDSELTVSDRENIRIIQNIEANYPESLDERLIGYWIIIRYYGDRYTELWDAIDNRLSAIINDYPFFSFYPNGTVYIGDINYYGLWQVKNNVLIIKHVYDQNVLPKSLSFSVTGVLVFDQILSPNGKKYLTGDFFETGGDNIKIHDYPGIYDK